MKYNYLLSLTVAFLFLTIFNSCEKKEHPIILPPGSDAIPGRINMGENYETQVFYDFETNSVVKTSDCSSWDLAFESDKDGYHLWMNGGKGVLIANSHAEDFKTFTTVPASITTASFLFDDPSGNADSTALGNWRDTRNATKGEVYIAKLNDTSFYKFRLLAVTDSSYSMAWCNIKSIHPDTIVLRKDPDYNFIYFSFTSGLVTPEPAKNTWDVVFTRYRFIYRDLNNFQYYVNGVLLNPYNTSAASDSTMKFANIDATTITKEVVSHNRDVIGFDWKKYNFTTARYEVNPDKNYILNTRNGQMIKLHFLDFYSSTGVKGSPSFESERLR